MHVQLYIKLNYYACPYWFCLSFFGTEISLKKTGRWQQLHTASTADPCSPIPAVLPAGACTQDQEPWPAPASGTDRAIRYRSQGSDAQEKQAKGDKRAIIRKFREESALSIAKAFETGVVQT